MNPAKGTLPPASKPALRKALRPLVLLALFGLGMAVGRFSHAAPAESPAGSPPSLYNVELTYQETDEALGYVDLGVKGQRAAFEKEPPLDKKDVFRGLLLCGERPDQATAFLWDKPNGRLCLDLNRNRDLTDDPNGIFASPSKDDNQSFTNIHWVFPADTGKRAVRLALEFYAYRGSNLRVSGQMCYLWQAKISLHGADWQIGVVEAGLNRKASTPPQWLLLRPWDERQRPFHLTSSSPDFCDFTTNLFFGNQAYALGWRYQPGGDAGKYQLALKEQTPTLGELNVTGAGLHRLILVGSRGLTLLVDKPQGTLRLPVGTYSLEEIWLRQGEVEVLRTKAGKVRVDARRPETLFAGGPLSNSVSLSSQGDSLQINYKLLGADGGAYRLPRPDYQHPPEFAVFQGTNQLATGKFRYG